MPFILQRLHKQSVKRSPSPTETMDDIASEDQEELEVLAELVDIMGPGTETSTMGKSGMHEIQVKWNDSAK